MLGDASGVFWLGAGVGDGLFWCDALRTLRSVFASSGEVVMISPQIKGLKIAVVDAAREWALKACAERPDDVQLLDAELKPTGMYLDDRTNKAINYITVKLLIKDADDRHTLRSRVADFAAGVDPGGVHEDGWRAGDRAARNA